MTLQLIVNLLMLGFSVFCFFYIGGTMPASPVNELGAEQWPQAIIIILSLGIIWNIIKLFRDNDKKEILNFGGFGKDIISFFKSKLFVGMIIVVVMSLCYEPLGFMASSLMFLIAYGYLLGEKRPLVLIGSSVVITAILYVGFAVFLGVMLPRGQVTFLRNFALFIESVVPRF